MKIETKKLVTLSMFAAIAFIMVTFLRVPIVLFFKYDPKDVMITIAGFIYGPLSALLVSLVVSFIEMVTISDTGILGFIMNVISTSVFACLASYIFIKGKRTNKAAVLGLGMGYIVMVITMLLWNYLITPLYMAIPREEVVKLLIPAILPFNLVKGGLNSAFTLLLYKPVVQAFERSNLGLEASYDRPESNRGVVILSLFVLAACTLFVLAINHKI
ncbi:MAG: ECF transporter S component [Tissierellia bacterium]|nr:ECF transporter S component [Tissierellia bacterium]